MSENLDVKYDICSYDIINCSKFKDGKAICNYKDFYDNYVLGLIDENFFPLNIKVSDFDNNFSNYNDGYLYDKYLRRIPGSCGLDYKSNYRVSKFNGNKRKVIFDGEADLIFPFCNDRTFYKNDNLYYLVDSNFKHIDTYDYIVSARKFGDGISFIKVFDWDFYENYHKITNKSMSSYIENMVPYFAIDVNGNRINDLEFEDCTYFSNGRCFVRFNGNDYYSLIDTDFNIVSDLKVSGESNLVFNNDYTFITNYDSNEKYFIDKNGKRCSINYDIGYCDLPNNYFVVRDREYWCILDKELNVISKLYDPKFKYLFHTSLNEHDCDYFSFLYYGKDNYNYVIFDKNFNIMYKSYQNKEFSSFGSNGLIPMKLNKDYYGYVDLDFNLVNSKVYAYHVTISTKFDEEIDIVANDIDELNNKIILELNKLLENHKNFAVKNSGGTCIELIKACEEYLDVDNEINDLINSLNGNFLEENVYTKK